MATEKLSKCDACGKTYSDQKEYYWADCNAHIVLSFKNHPNVQHDAFDGDLCEKCARKVHDKIVKLIENIKTGKE
jgi:hypothetical protein